MKLKKLAAVLITVLMCTVMLPVTAFAAQSKGITLDKTSISLSVGKSYTLKRTVTGFKSATITWKSSDSSVASVSKGKVTAKKAGSAVITATIKGTSYKATCKVTVKKASSGKNTSFSSLKKFAASDLDDLPYKKVSAKNSNLFDYVTALSGADSIYLDAETTDGSEAMTMACDDKGNIALSYDMDGEKVKVIIKNQKLYILDPATKTGLYTKLDKSGMEEYVESIKDSFEELSSFDTSDLSPNEKIKTCTVSIAGKDYTVEKADDGCILFKDDGSMYAIVSSDPSADVNVLIINEYSKDVPSGAFSIPKGYELTDLDEALSSYAK